MGEAMGFVAAIEPESILSAVALGLCMAIVGGGVLYSHLRLKPRGDYPQRFAVFAACILGIVSVIFLASLIGPRL